MSDAQIRLPVTLHRVTIYIGFNVRAFDAGIVRAFLALGVKEED